MLFVGVLVAEEVGSDALAVDGCTWICAVLRAPHFDHGALGIIQGKVPSCTADGIPHLLDELEALPDRQSVDIDGWITMRRNLCSASGEDNYLLPGMWVTYNA